MMMLKILLIVFSLLMFTGCTTKELTVLDTECAHPSLDLSQYPEPAENSFGVHKGAMVVTIKKDDYERIKNTNQDIKDKYVKLRSWVIINIENGLIKSSHK